MLRSSLARVVPVLVLAGCWVTWGDVEPKLLDPDADTDTDTDADSDADSDTDTDTDALIQSIEPSWALSSGGTTFEIGVTGIDPYDVAVYLDGESVEVVDATATSITAGVPPMAADRVDVEVESGDAWDVVYDGLTIWTAAEGQITTVGEVRAFHHVGTLADTPDYGRAFVTFIEPATFSHRQLWGSDWDTCSIDYTPPDVEVREPGLSEVSILGASGWVALPWSNSLGRFGGEVPFEDVYDVGTVALSSDAATGWPGLSVAGAFPTPAASFTLLDPPMSSATPPVVGRGAITFTWDADERKDWVLIELEREQGGSVDDTVTCVAYDDGQFTVGDAWLSNWSTGDPIRVTIGRGWNASVPTDWDGGVTSTAGVLFEVGLLTQGT